MKSMRVILKNKPLKKFKQGACAWCALCAGAGSTFGVIYCRKKVEPTETRNKFISKIFYLKMLHKSWK